MLSLATGILLLVCSVVMLYQMRRIDLLKASNDAIAEMAWENIKLIAEQTATIADLRIQIDRNSANSPLTPPVQ